MRLLVINEGLGNYKYPKGYKIFEEVIKELETIYLINPVEVKVTSVERGEKSLDEYYKYLKEISKPPFVSIGGDHSITYSFYQNFLGYKLLIFDAHPDLDFSTGKPTNEDWLRLLIENGFIDGEDIFLIGIRNFAPHEMDFIKDNRINVLLSHEIRSEDDIRDFVPKDKYYVSIDVDVFDPAFAPGTYYREPFGLNPKTVLNSILNYKILSADINEINLNFDENNKTIRLGIYLAIWLWKHMLG